MKNLIVSFEKLPKPVLEAIETTYPYGFDHLTFEFEMPSRNEIYTALSFSIGDTNYVIKLEKRERNVDRYDGD